MKWPSQVSVSVTSAAYIAFRWRISSGLKFRAKPYLVTPMLGPS